MGTKKQLKKKCSGRVNARKRQKTGNRKKKFFCVKQHEKEQLLRSKITKLKDKKSTNNWFILNNSLKNAVAMEPQYVRF